MSKGRVLLADNNEFFLETCAEYLESQDYKVLRASSPAEARQVLTEDWVHLAILDLRLANDADENDKSGLMLAKKVAPAVPKIILTDYPTIQDVRSALRPSVEGPPPVIDFVDKRIKLAGLSEAVEEAFTRHVQINSSLVINLNENNPITLHHLANLIEPSPQSGQLLSRAEELEDLFRQLFYEKSQINIDRLLWQREGRVAVSVFAFAEGEATESLIVVCGRNALVTEEAQRYRIYAPKAPGPNTTTMTANGETTHFAANVYSLANADLEKVHSLVDMYRSFPEKAFAAALKTLYEKPLAEWYQEKRILEENKTLDQLYRERLGLKTDRASQSAFKERVQALARQIPTLGVGIESDSGRLTVSFGDRSFSYPDPTSVLYQSFDSGSPALLMTTPGMLSGENILSDAGDRAWVTDFAGAGLAPLLWNFVALEAAIRFDWVEAVKLQWVHDMEQYLLTSDLSKLYTSDVEAPLRKPMKAIHSIRTLASKMSGKDPQPYHLGILFQAASRIIKFNPAFRLTPNELARLAHVLMAAAMICDYMVKNRDGLILTPERGKPGISIDKVNRLVWVDGVNVPLRGHSYYLLCNLYDHPNQLRTRRELIEQVFGEKYDEADESQINRLNMAIHRLREKIGDDPEDPRYLITHLGEGYRLARAPEES